MIQAQVFLVDGGAGRFVTRTEFVDLNRKNQYATYEVDGQKCAGATQDIKKSLDEVKAVAQSLMPDALTTIRHYFKNIVIYKHIDEKSYQLSLTMRWEQGKFVDELINSAAKYGSRTVHAYAEDTGLSASSVYQIQRLYNMYNMSGIKDLVAKKIPWRTVVVLLSVEDRKYRTELEDQFSVLKHEGIEELVKKHNKSVMSVAEKAGKKVDKRGGAAIGTVFRSASTLFEDVNAKISEFDDAFLSFLKLDEDKRTKETKATLKAAMGNLRETTKRIEKVFSHLDKAKATHSEAAKKPGG